MFLTEDEVLMGYKDTDQNISARCLTLQWIFCSGMGIVWSRPQPEHESVMPLLLLNVSTH